MTALAETRVLWDADNRPACSTAPRGLDLTELTPEAGRQALVKQGLYVTYEGRGALRSYREDMASARALCAGCPVLQQCKDRALRLPVAGFAAGMTQDERRYLRRRRHLTGRAVQACDVVPRSKLDAVWVSEQTEADEHAGRGRSAAFDRAVRDMRLAGLVDADIADRLGVERGAVRSAAQRLAGTKPTAKRST